MITDDLEPVFAGSYLEKTHEGHQHMDEVCRFIFNFHNIDSKNKRAYETLVDKMRYLHEGLKETLEKSKLPEDEKKAEFLIKFLQHMYLYHRHHLLDLLQASRSYWLALQSSSLL